MFEVGWFAKLKAERAKLRSWYIGGKLREEGLLTDDKLSLDLSRKGDVVRGRGADK